LTMQFCDTWKVLEFDVIEIDIEVTPL